MAYDINNESVVNNRQMWPVDGSWWEKSEALFWKLFGLWIDFYFCINKSIIKIKFFITFIKKYKFITLIIFKLFNIYIFLSIYIFFYFIFHIFLFTSSPRSFSCVAHLPSQFGCLQVKLCFSLLLYPSLSRFLFFPLPHGSGYKRKWRWQHWKQTLALLRHNRRLLLQGYEKEPLLGYVRPRSHTHTPTLAHIGAVTTKQSHIARVSLRLLPLFALLGSATKHALNFLITPGYKSADARVRTEIRLWPRLPHTHTPTLRLYTGLCLPPALESERTVVRCRHLHRSYVN